MEYRGGVVKPEDKNILDRIELGPITLNKGVNDAVPIQKSEILNSKKNGEFFIVGAAINRNSSYLYSYKDGSSIKCFRHYGQDVAVGGFVVMEISNINIEDGTARIDFKTETYPLQQSVLTKTNTTPFTPTEDYHPATKKYVDDLAGGDMVVVNVEDAVGPPNGYDDTTVFTFIQGDPNVLKQLILQKKYSQIIVNGVPCFGERDGNLLIYMKESLGVATLERQYNVIAEIDYSDIALYKDNIFWIYGRFSKPVMSLTKEIYITQRAYDQLPDTKLTDGCTYYIVEG